MDSLDKISNSRPAADPNEPIMIPQLCSTVLYVSKLASLVYSIYIIRKEKRKSIGGGGMAPRAREYAGSAWRRCPDRGMGLWSHAAGRMHKACARSSTPVHMATSAPMPALSRRQTRVSPSALKWAEREGAGHVHDYRQLWKDVACKSRKRQLGFGTEGPRRGVAVGTTSLIHYANERSGGTH